MEEYCCYILYVQDVVVNHMIMHILYMMRLVSMRACFFIRGEYVTHMKFRANPGNFIGLSYIGHSDLHITYYGLPCMYGIPLGAAGVGYVTQPLRNLIVL